MPCDHVEFYSERLVKARKPHTCCETGHIIQPGDKYWKIVGKWDGAFLTFAQCEAAYHFARFLNSIVATRPDGNGLCIPFTGVRDFIYDCEDSDLQKEWSLVCKGQVTRTT